MTGLADMEEGELHGEELTLETTNLGRMTFGSSLAVQKVTNLNYTASDLT